MNTDAETLRLVEVSLISATAAVGVLWFAAVCSRLWRGALKLQASYFSLWSFFSLNKKNQRVREIFEQRRASRFQSYMQTMWLCLAPSILFITIGATWAVTRSQTSPDLLSTSILASTAVFGAFWLVLFGNLERPAPWLVELSIATIYLLLAVPPAFSNSVMNYRWHTSISVLCQAFVCQLYPDRRMAWILNSICLAWRLATLYATPVLSDDPTMGEFITAVLAFLCNVGESLATVVTMEAESAALLGEREAQSSSKCLESLLSMLCDAVLTLRSDLTLVEPSLALASMLCRSPHLSQGIEGQAFAKFLASDDVERFETFVHSNSVAVNTAQSICVDLIDSMSCKVPVRIFHTCIIDPWDQSKKHLLGLVENAEPERLCPGDVPPMVTRSMSSNSSPMARSKSPDDAASSPSLASTVRGLRYWLPTEAGGAAEASLKLRTWLAVEVLEESETSRTCFGFSEGDADFVSRFRSSQQILRWLEYNHLMAALGARNHPKVRFGKVGFVNLSNSIEYRAIMRARLLQRRTVPGRGEDKDDEDTENVGEWEPLDLESQCAEFEIHMKPLKPPSRKRASRPRSSSRDGPLTRQGVAQARAIEAL